MAEWKDLSDDAFHAAQLLRKERRWRSCVSRAYYAAYACLTGSLSDAGVRFRFGGHNPSHEQVVRAIPNLARLRRDQQRRLKAAVRHLQRSRIAADYCPGETVDASLALDCVKTAAYVLRLMRVDL